MARPIRGIIEDVNDPTEFITFDSFEPLQKARNPVYDDVAVRGRAEPHVFYSHTEAKIVQFTLHFIASVDQGDNGNPRTVKGKEAFMESLVVPDYGNATGDNAAVLPPHLARIKILKMFDAIGTIRSLSCVDVPPYDIETGFPYQIDCSFSFHIEKFIGDPLGFREIRDLFPVR